MDVSGLHDYYDRFKALLRQADDIKNILRLKDVPSEDVHHCLTKITPLETESLEAKTREMTLQYLKLMLRSDQVGLSVYLRARRDYGISLLEMIAARDDCMQRATLSSDDAKKQFKLAYKAIRDCLLPSLYNINVVYSEKEVAMHLCAFSTDWVKRFIAICGQVLNSVKDITELSALWTQCILLNRSMAKQGVAFMTLLEDCFVLRAFELCNIKAGTIAPVEAEKNLIDATLYSFIGNPMHVAMANAIIECVNIVRYFAHPKLLSMMEEDLTKKISNIPELRDFTQKALEPFKS